jgi:hypothetical protein
MSAMAVEGRVKFDEQNEMLRRAAADRLGEDPQVIVIRQSDEQIRQQAERDGLTEARAQQ